MAVAKWRTQYHEMQTPGLDSHTDRRGFFKGALALVLGGISILIPLAAGMRVLFDPLRRKGAGGSLVKVTMLEAVPDDGVPRKFTILSSKLDAWNRLDNVPIGAVYLRRTKEGKVEALNVICPHAGCFVDFSNERGQFQCPCHESSFALDGAIASRNSPSPRAMDRLIVKVDDNGAVWVAFQNFQAGRADQVPVA